MSNRNLLICDCGDRMQCLKNGVLVRVKGGSIAKADMWGCEPCGVKFFTGFGDWLEHRAEYIASFTEHYPEWFFDFEPSEIVLIAETVKE